jgi:hypothetical protein
VLDLGAGLDRAHPELCAMGFELLPEQIRPPEQADDRGPHKPLEPVGAEPRRPAMDLLVDRIGPTAAVHPLPVVWYRMVPAPALAAAEEAPQQVRTCGWPALERRPIP